MPLSPADFPRLQRAVENLAAARTTLEALDLIDQATEIGLLLAELDGITVAVAHGQEV